MTITNVPLVSPKPGDYRIVEMPGRYLIQRYREIVFMRPVYFMGVCIKSIREIQSDWKPVFDQTKPISAEGLGPTKYDVLWFSTLSGAQDFVNKVKYDAATFPRYWYCN